MKNLKHDLFWVCMCLAFISACDKELDKKPMNNKPDTQAVTLSPIASGLNFPVSIDFIDNQDPAGIGTCSVLQPGMILVANRGMAGDNANSIQVINPLTTDESQRSFIFSSSGYRDRYGTSGVDGPTGVSFIGPYVWVSNVANMLGSIAALDPNPCVEPNGINGQPGEPIDGPLGYGVFDSQDFSFRVVEIAPRDGSTYVSTNVRIYARFSQPVNVTTFAKGFFAVEVDDTDIPNLEDPVGVLQFSQSNTVVEYSYQRNGLLGEKTKYRITIDKDIEDAAGNELDGDPNSYGSEDFISYFTTASYGNPQVTSVTPNDGATNVALRPKITICFSKPMKKPSDSAIKIIKEGSTSGVGFGDIYPSANGETCYYILFTANLEDNTRYRIVVTPNAVDMAGNQLDQIPGGDLDMFESWFTTGQGAATGFCLDSSSPVTGTSGVTMNSNISMNFTKAVDQGTINAGFSVTSSYGAVAGNFSTTNDGATVVFQPTESLRQCDSITVTITNALKAQDGEAFSGWCADPVQPWIIQFNVVCENPYVASNIPVCSLRNVTIDTVITVNFSELMDLSSINSSTFTVTENDQTITDQGTIITGNSPDGYSWLQFRIDNAGNTLRANAHYRYGLSIYARDLDGNNLDQNRDLRDGLTPFSCEFWTGEQADEYPPCVSNSTPQDGDQGISIFSYVTVCFTKTMDMNTINATNFEVKGSSGAVPGNYSISEDLRCVNFLPSASFPENDMITMTLKTGITDLQGRQLDGDCNGVGGEAGDSVYIRFQTSAGKVVINEIVSTPQQDWNGDSSISTDKDEWVEIYNGTSTTFNLTSQNWSLIMTDTTPETELIGDSTGAQEIYSLGSSAQEFKPNGYLIILNPEGAMNQDVWIQLLDNTSDLLDDAEIGSEDFKGDGSANNAPKGNSSSLEDEAVSRCPNGLDTDNNASDFTKTRASWAASNNSTCISMNASIGEPLPYKQTGMGGLVHAGAAPDDYNSYSLLTFAFNAAYNNLYALDFDDGIYTILTEVTNITDLEWIADKDGTPGHGKLFVTNLEDTITIINLTTSGQLGAVGTTVTVAPTDTNPRTSFFSQYLDMPVSIAYSTYSDTVFIANRGDGTVTECSIDGKFLHVYDTGLGAGTLSAIDIGDTLGGETVLIAITGGQGIDEYSGPHGSLWAFQPLH